MNKTAPEQITWLPPSEEWDFRSVTPAECRMACHWEYSREFGKLVARVNRPVPAHLVPKETHGHIMRGNLTEAYCPPDYHQAAKEFFPRAWVTLTPEERGRVMDSFFTVSAIRVSKLGEYLKRTQVKLDGSNDTNQWHLQCDYVLQPNFSLYGVEAVIKEFRIWARKEARKYRQSPRAKAAVPPFDVLKWLAVKRLDAERCRVPVTIEAAQAALKKYRRLNPQTDPQGVFPSYASPGAWSKAKRDAQRYMDTFRNKSISLHRKGEG